jgi:hypothetical protein
MYSGRQREVRERRMHASVEERAPERPSLLDLDETPDYDLPSPWGMPLRGRASAA